MMFLVRFWRNLTKKAQCVEWIRIRNFRIGSGRSGLRKNFRSGSGKKVRIRNTVKKTDLLSVSAWQYLLSNAMLAMTMASISRALPWAWSSLLVTSCTFLVMDKTPWVTVPGRRPLSNFFWMPLNKNMWNRDNENLLMFLVIRRAWCADQTVLCLVRNIGIACVSRLFYFEPSRSFQNVLPREKKSFIRKTVTTLSQTMILPMNILTSVVDPDPYSAYGSTQVKKDKFETKIHHLET